LTSLYRYAASVPELKSPVALTLGSFDGLHVGHQALITQLASVDAATRVVVSFYPHPDSVLGKAPITRQLSTLHQRMQLLQELGVDIFLCLHFTPAFSRMLAGDFLQQIILDRLHAAKVVLGPDARVGHQGQGTPEFICEYLNQRGCQAQILPFLTAEGGARISSRRIRELIREGRVHEVPALLGRPYVLEGRVRQGDRRGRSLGFPTANLYLQQQELPREGVYITRTLLAGRQYPSVTNLGYRPTFYTKATPATSEPELLPVLETHLLTYQGAEFYRERVEVQLLQRLRDEQRFSGVAALQQQLMRDCEQARAFFMQLGELV
jgi:riboflavin kinase/FMN adenylyltransferase